MRTRITLTFASVLTTLGGTLAAQEPLSAIEWLKKSPPPGFTSPILLEPPVTNTALLPDVAVTPLENNAAPVGLVPGDVTGLPADLWTHSNADTLVRLIGRVPVQNSPAMQALLYTLLLSENAPPAGKDAARSLLLARIDRLFELGAVEPAQALAEQGGHLSDPAVFARWMDATLLTGDEDQSCREIARAPRLAPGYAARIFCDARMGDWQTAALLLETAHALEVLPKPQLDLLDRFLSPEIYEGAPPLSAPDNPTPLTFRLYEAIGERLPTADLPRAFATADLRDVAGWKAQLEAAERLARIGAISPNLLLGLYTARKPAASGGIWDRVAALQRFETALDSRSPEAVAKTLPDVWDAMREVRLEVSFATLFADRLSELDIAEPRMQDLVWRIRLLGPELETAGARPQSGPVNDFLHALAQGRPGDVASAPDGLARAIAAGFDESTRPPDAILRNLESRRLGEAILRTMVLFDNGRRGDPGDLSAALASLHQVGLEKPARQGAIQLMLLERE